MTYKSVLTRCVIWGYNFNMLYKVFWGKIAVSLLRQMGVCLSKEAFITQAVFWDHCLITIITIHKSQIQMLCITRSVPSFVADGKCDVEQGAYNLSCKSLTHPWKELLMLLTFSTGVTRWTPPLSVRISSGGKMLLEQKPHHFIASAVFLAWANVLHPPEGWSQNTRSFVHLPVSIPLNLHAEHPSMSQNHPRFILHIFATLCSFGPHWTMNPSYD